MRRASRTAALNGPLSSRIQTLGDSSYNRRVLELDYTVFSDCVAAGAGGVKQTIQESLLCSLSLSKPIGVRAPS